MTSVSNVNRENPTFADDECGLNIQRRHSFLAPENSSSGDGYNNGEEDHESTSSECPSAGLTTRPMSTTESSENLSHHTGFNMPTNTSYTCQMPWVNMQPAGTQVYQPSTYDNQNQILQGSSSPNTPIRVPSFGCGPVQLQQIPMQPLQQQVVYQMQPNQYGSQDWARISTPTATVPYMMGSVSHPQVNNYDAQHLTSSVVSSAVSTPIISSPAYCNAYGYINTPVLSSAPCTPIPCSTSRLEVPPLLDLIKHNARNYTVPQRISCNINTGPVRTAYQSMPETPSSVSRAFNDWTEDLPKMSTNAHSSGENVEEIQKSSVWDDDNVWRGNLMYEEWKNGGSNLFITWSGRKADLVNKLHSFNLKVRNIFSTSDENILNVVFETHPIARKAFTMQNQIRVRIVPPKNSHCIWWRNPSPKFLVKFETKCRLIVKKGKAECHDIVGELLPGCLITADQLKGHRIRVLCCEGSFMFPGGKVVNMKGVPNKTHEKASLGWISYRCKHTKETLVIRRSWNKLGDYIYQE